MLGGHGFRLPTEAEWEYACRAPKDPGSATKYPFGSDESDLASYAWFGEDLTDGKTHPVGQKKPNRWGLYDMQSNVFEWCQDVYSEVSYKFSRDTDPFGPTADGASSRVFQGGC